jgi:hypothetical protein
MPWEPFIKRNDPELGRKISEAHRKFHNKYKHLASGTELSILFYNKLFKLIDEEFSLKNLSYYLKLEKGADFVDTYGSEWTTTLKRGIRERDNYTCQLCSAQQKEKAFAVHHIDYNKKNCNPTNLITLCHNCHGKTNGNRGKYKKRLHKLMEIRYE